MGTSNLLRRFGERLSRLTHQPGLTTLRLTFTHGAAACGPAVSGALYACFDQLTKDYVLPEEWVSAGSVNFRLSPARRRAAGCACGHLHGARRRLHGSPGLTS